MIFNTTQQSGRAKEIGELEKKIIELAVKHDGSQLSTNEIEALTSKMNLLTRLMLNNEII